MFLEGSGGRPRGPRWVVMPTPGAGGVGTPTRRFGRVRRPSRWAVRSREAYPRFGMGQEALLVGWEESGGSSRISERVGRSSRGGREVLWGPTKGPGRSRSPFRQVGRGREAYLKGQERSGGQLGSPGGVGRPNLRSGSGREWSGGPPEVRKAYPEVREGLRGPTGGPEGSPKDQGGVGWSTRMS